MDNRAGLDREALAALASEKRLKFLGALLDRLTLSARGQYVEAGASEARAIEGLRCHNELAIIVATQIRSSLLGGEPAYPDDAFIKALDGVASLGSCEWDLEWSMKEALVITSQAS